MVHVRHPDHIGGPARSTSVSSISVIAPLMLKVEHFFMRGGAPLAHGLLVAKSKTMHTLSLTSVKSEHENRLRHQYRKCGKATTSWDLQLGLGMSHEGRPEDRLEITATT
jgi:hypothetical protein